MTGWTSEELDRIGTAQELNQRIDAAYRAKYGRYGSSYLEPMTSGETRTTTLRLQPRAAKGAA
jgi:hypothetical protein